MDGLFDLDPADTGTLFDTSGLDRGRTLGMTSIGAGHRSIRYQPLHAPAPIDAEVFCDGPLPNTVWALNRNQTQVVVDTRTFREVDYTPPSRKPQ
jgi:hypothetical protein